MAILKILLADADEKYLHVLKRRFTEELKNKASIEIITNQAYFTQQFSMPQTLSLLVVSEDWYEAGLERHNIANLFLLTTNRDEAPKNGHPSIYKYDAVKALFERIYKPCEFPDDEPKRPVATKVIAVYSPIGGIGTTTIAIGLGFALARQKKKVLYLATDGLQNFQFLLPADRLPNGAERPLRNDDGAGDVFPHLTPLLRIHAGLSYLPPFQQPLAALRWKAEHWINLCQFVRKSKQYDYIILDCPSEFSSGNSKLLGPVELRLIIAGQSHFDVLKLGNFTRCFDSSVGRTEYICSRYDKNQPNCLLDEAFAASVPIKEYIEETAELSTPGGLLKPNVLDRLTVFAEGG